MKKILCFILSAVLVFNNAIFVYADTSGTIPTPVPTLIPIPSSKIIEILAKIMHPEFGAVEDFFKKDEVKEELDKEGAITYDNDYVYINSTTVNNINNIVQDSVHALDGYYLLDSDYALNDFTSLFYWYKNFSDDDKKIFTDFFSNYETVYTFEDVTSQNVSHLWLKGINATDYLYINGSYVYCSATSKSSVDGLSVVVNQFTHFFAVSRDNISVGSPDAFVNKKVYTFGAPFKIFYSENDLNKYLDKGRTYAPKLPNVTIKIPVKYINNSVSLPDITYNITTENKTEVEIQNQYDTTIKNYLDSLDNFTDGTDPTPTPKPDGGFTDGTTPTPTPSIGDGGDDSGNGKVDLSEITDLLKKILDKLTSFADSHSKFEKTITDYIESTDGKLDQIIDAIDKLSQGKEDGEDYKCKYDYTELSDYLKKLWNDSDKKFDTMIDLLEENNEYQQKLVDTLDSIKSILIKESIMDSFKDRSKETANKAKEKFPTSVPWDIAIVINAMSATPEEPKFNLPIKIASLNIDENIEVDLSSGEWEKLAKTCRYMLSLLFVLFMVQLSRRLFFSKGDDD